MRAAAIPILTGWALASPLKDGDNDPNTQPVLLKPHSDMNVLIRDGAFGKDEVIDYATRPRRLLKALQDDACDRDVRVYAACENRRAAASRTSQTRRRDCGAHADASAHLRACAPPVEQVTARFHRF